MEDLHVLGHTGDIAPIIAEIEAIRRYAVHEDLAAGQRILALQHLYQRALARSALAPQSGHPPSWQLEVHPIEQHRSPRPAQPSALDGQRTSKTEWPTPVARLWLRQQQIKQASDRDGGALQR